MFKQVGRPKIGIIIGYIILVAFIGSLWFLHLRTKEKKVYCQLNQINIKTTIKAWEKKNGEQWPGSEGKETYEMLHKYLIGLSFDCLDDNMLGLFKPDKDDYNTDTKGNVYCTINSAHNK